MSGGLFPILLRRNSYSSNTYPLLQNPYADARNKAKLGDGPEEAAAAMPGLETPAARDAMGAVADAIEDATRERERLQAGLRPKHP